MNGEIQNCPYRQTANRIIDMLSEYIQHKYDINPGKDEDGDQKALIYGEEYYRIEDTITENIKSIRERLAWVRLYDNMEESEVYILVPANRIDDLKTLLNKYRAENKAYNYDDFLDILNKEGLLFDKVSVLEHIYF